MLTSQQLNIQHNYWTPSEAGYIWLHSWDNIITKSTCLIKGVSLSWIDFKSKIMANF